LHRCEIRLRDVWPRSAIMEKAVLASGKNHDLQKMMEVLSDPWDEGIVQLLICLLLCRHILSSCLMFDPCVSHF